MAVFLFIGNAADFPLAPYFIPELNALPWTEDFRVISKSAYKIFLDEIGTETSISRRSSLVKKLENIITAKNFTFAEEQYRSTNLDIDFEINAGNFTSGLHHYLVHGIIENRPAKISLDIEIKSKTIQLQIEANETVVDGPTVAGVQSVQMMTLLDHSTIGPAIPYAVRKLRSATVHQVYFCEPWLAYDLAWNIADKSRKDLSISRDHFNNISI